MQESTLNISSTPTAARQEAYDQLENGRRPSLARSSSGADSLDGDSATLNSSPFVASVTDETQSQSSNQENISPSKDKRRSRIMSGHEISPLKMLQRSSTSSDASSPSEERAPAAPKSPRKSMSGMRRFPIRVGGAEGNGRSRPQSIPPPVREHTEDEQVAEEEEPPSTTVSELTLEEAIAQNPNVKHAIEIFEDTLDSLGDEDDDLGPLDEDVPTVKAPMDTQPHQVVDINGDGVGDDTMMSAFSDFSVIPNMTTFARLGGRTPSQMAQSGRRSSNNTTNLLDFTDNLRYPGGRSSPTKGMTAADAKTPQRQGIANLLDFEIPPMPTPRSVPSISARELESLKSNFMSEISSLKATLSGKEAEAASLKTALMDAEKRAGESMEQLREERTVRQQVSEDKETWEKRGKEMETVLRQVKDEIMITQKERETLEAKLEESEGRREAAEFMAQEAESKMAVMRASKVNGDATASPGGVKSPKTTSTQREIEAAVEKVARELHAAYKSKHEAKVAALKKNYEVRWDKKIRELEIKIEELTRENEELRVGRDATLTKVELESTERREQAVKDSAEIKGLHAEVEKLEASLRSVQGDNAELRQQLECERVEKGELVTLAEELMQMQSNQSILAQNGNSNNANNTGSSDDEQPQPTPQNQRTPVMRKTQPIVVDQATPRRVPQRASAPVPNRGQLAHGSLARPATTTPKKATSMMTSPSVSGLGSGIPGSNGNKPRNRNSMIGRPGGGAMGGLGMSSGLKPPASSRIGGPPSAHVRTQSNVSGLARPGSGLARPGGLMSSIQQMGSYRGRGE